MKIFMGFLLLTLALAAGVSHAQSISVGRNQRLVIESLTGVVDGTGRNSIDIIDEREDWRRKRFTYMGDTARYRKGDRVRIYYRIPGYTIENIRKMTPVQYQESGQNAGYLLKEKTTPHLPVGK